MRPEIIEQLPRLADGQLLLVVAPPTLHNLNQIKRSIHDLNRHKKWIKAEFSTDVSDDKITPKIGFMIATDRLSGAVVTKLRRRCKHIGVPYLQQAVLPGEVRHILEHMFEHRIIPPEPNGSKPDDATGTNGSEVAVPTAPVEDAALKPAVEWRSQPDGTYVTQAGPMPLQIDPEQPAGSDGDAQPSVETEPAPADTVLTGEDEFLKILDDVPAFLDDLKLAVMEIKQKNAALEAKLTEASAECAAKQAEIDRLQLRINDQRPMLDSLTDTNKNLVRENEHLRALQKAFEGVQQAMERAKHI